MTADYWAVMLDERRAEKKAVVMAEKTAALSAGSMVEHWAGQ